MAETAATQTTASTKVQNPAGGTTQSSVTPAAKDQPTAPPAAGSPRMMKIKVDGKEVELPETEVLELASAGKASNARFQDAAKLKREADQIIQFAKDNPEEIFKKTGLNPREWAEKYLLGELQKEAETPQQKTARENEEKLRKYEADEKKRTAESERQEEERLTNEQREKYDKLFTQALFESGLPRTKFTVMRMAQLQKINLKKSFDCTAQQLAKIVREDYVAEQKALMGALDGDALIDFLGPEIAKKFSKAQIAKLKNRGTGGSSSAAGKGPVARNQPEPGMSWKDYQRKNRGRG